ncbi:MAG TPA: hypothetical protein VMQ51_06520 [Candidatus Binatia bacterium]|nr:hypothetical protein [Candidatus Binatia bacterium]
MATLESIVGGVFLVVLLAPVLLLFLTLFVLVPLAHLLPPPASIARSSFTCPVTRRRVSAAFLTEGGAGQPTDVTACSIFGGGEVRCAKGCLALGRVGWAPSPMVPRYALLSDGVAHR